MAQPLQIYHLPDELLSEVLSFVLAYGSRIIRPGPHTFNGGSYGNGDGPHGIDRQYTGPGESSDLDRFRLVCTRFMRISTPRKFSHFNLRFSELGFRRLEELLHMQLACYVKSVTYLVRPFYQGNDWAPVLRMLDKEDPDLARVHKSRLQEQIDLVSSDTDISQLRTAIASFAALQEVKLLRLQDEADERLLDSIRRHSLTNGHGHSFNHTRFDWASACSRAVTSLGVSLLEAQCTSIRFIGPQISLEASHELLGVPSTIIAAVAPRLASLDITFDSSKSLPSAISSLPGVFDMLFREATNLVAIHIGFPSKRPIWVPLDTIFHSVHWNRALHSLSLQGWRLTAEDLISLLQRSKNQLRSLRLSSIYLETGKWSSVLNFLRREMEQLECLELSGIDYATHFDSVSTSTGVEIYDYVPLSIPSSPSAVPVAGIPSSRTIASNLPVHLLRDRKLPYCTSSLDKVRGLTLNDMGDDGVHVRPDQERLWESWVLASGWEKQKERELRRYSAGHVNGHGRGHWNGNGNGNGNGVGMHI